MRYRKIVEVSAIEWTGDDQSFLCLVDATQGGFRRVAEGIYTAEVYDYLHDTWVKLRTGDFIIQGAQNEFYPCERSVFEQTYEPA